MQLKVTVSADNTATYVRDWAYWETGVNSDSTVLRVEGGAILIDESNVITVYSDEELSEFRVRATKGPIELTIRVA